MKRDLTCGTINHWKVLLLSFLVSVFACFAFVSTSVFAEEMDDSSLQSSSSATRAAYRLYNPYTGEHFFTLDSSEYKNLGKVGWNQEGTAWIAPAKSDTPVYRLYNPYSGDHHFTTDKTEYENLGKIGWKQEGIGWYSDDSKGVSVYRLYNPYATVGTHHFTSDKSEYDKLPSYGWRPESIAWYGVKTEAFAVYSADDRSLNFYKRKVVPARGEKIEGKTVTAVFRGLEASHQSWNNYKQLIIKSEVVDEGIRPSEIKDWFCNCAYLEKIQGLNRLDVSSVENMTGLFSNCPSLSEIQGMSSWNTSSVTKISGIFKGCKSLKQVDVSNWNLTNLSPTSTYIGSNAISLTSILSSDVLENLTANNWKLPSNFVIHGFDKSFSKLKSLTMTGWDVSDTRGFVSLCSQMSSLTYVNLSGLKLGKLNSLHAWFTFCPSLMKIEGISDLDTSNVVIMSNVFVDCANLSADCSKWNVSKVRAHRGFANNSPKVIQPKFIS